MWRGVPWREGVCVCACVCACVCVYGVVGDGGSCCLHHKIKIRIFQFVKATTGGIFQFVKATTGGIFQFVKATTGGISTICVTLATFVFKQVTLKVLPCKKTMKKHKRKKKYFSPSTLTLTNYINSGTDCKVSLA